MTFLTSALSFIFAPFIAVGIMLGTALAPEPAYAPLGASEAIPTTIAFFETTLASAISDTATSFNLTSATDKDGTVLASSTYAFVIDEGSSNEEIVIADCTGTACVRVERGISARTGNTEVTALKKAHRRGASVKMTDAPAIPLMTRIMRGEGTVDFTPSQGGNLVTKTYVDALSFGSIVAATESDDGFVELATLAEALAGTTTGGSGSTLVLQSRDAPTLIDTATPVGSLLPYASSTAPTGWLVADGTAYSTTTYSDLFAVVGYSYGGSGSTFQVPDFRSSVILGSGTRTRTMSFNGATEASTTIDTITVTSNDWLQTGQAVVLSTSGTLPTGLSATTYYVIYSSSTAIKLATSRANADAGTAVDITAIGSGTSTLTQTLTARTNGQTGGEETHFLTEEELASHTHSQALADDANTTYTLPELGQASAIETATYPLGSAGSDTPHNTLPPYTVATYIIKY